MPAPRARRHSATRRCPAQHERLTERLRLWTGDSRGFVAATASARCRNTSASRSVRDIANAPSRKLRRGQMSKIETLREERMAGTLPSREALLTPVALPAARLRGVILLLAVACGMAVANIYYS